MPVRQKKVFAKPIKVIQFNANRRHVAISSLLESIKDDVDIVLIQEPPLICFPGRPILPVSAAGWSPTLPKPIEALVLDDAQKPRVMCYHKPRADYTLTLRTDIHSDLDYMTIEIEQAPYENIFITNINQISSRNDENDDWSIERLKADGLDQDATILLGDFNVHHPTWETIQGTPSARARAFADWINGEGYHAVNEFDTITYASNDLRSTSVLDLTFVNRTTAQIVHEWKVDSSQSIPSDHFPISFTIDRGNADTGTESQSKWNWKKADEKEFRTAFKAHLGTRIERVNTLRQPISWSKATIDDAVLAIQEAMTCAADDSVPLSRGCSRSVPWWNSELDELKRIRAEARIQSLKYLKEIGIVHDDLLAAVATADNRFTKAVKRTKRNFYAAELEKATNTDIYKFRSWSQGRRNYQSPPMKLGDGQMAVAPKAKLNLLHGVHFPIAADLPGDFPDLVENQENDITWNKVTIDECVRAFSTISPDKAPGADGFTTRALLWAWSTAYEAFHLVIASTIEYGYHPAVFHDSISPALKKPGKPDYAEPRAWRLVHLLSTFGKLIEKIIANRLLHYAAAYNLVSPAQFGAMPGKSTTDAAMSFTHDVQCALNHGLITSVVTFDIQGYFDQVDHKKLLCILRKKGIPLPICKWVRSFVSDRRASISLDGMNDEMKPVVTGCPQGSPVSGVLANYYSSTLLEILDEAARNFQRGEGGTFVELDPLPGESVPDLLKREQRITTDSCSTQITATCFVDDGKIYTSSICHHTNAARLTNVFKRVAQWTDEYGLNIDPKKVDYCQGGRYLSAIEIKEEIELRRQVV